MNTMQEKKQHILFSVSPLLTLLLLKNNNWHKQIIEKNAN